MKKLVSLLLLFFLFSSSVTSHNPRFALHVRNPLTVFQKTTVKMEFSSLQSGILLFATQYYGSMPDYPGTQVGIEGRHFLVPDERKRSTFFFYGKALGGYQQERAAYGEGFLSHDYVPSGFYSGLGGGVGTHINIHHFFIEFNGGLKGILSTSAQELPFYITGPGSVLELHFNLGYQF